MHAFLPNFSRPLTGPSIAGGSILLLLLLVGRSIADGEEATDWKGKKVMPRMEAEIIVDNESVDYTSGGFSLPWIVQDVKDDMLLVGDRRKGWVEQSEVVPLDEAAEYYTPLTQTYPYEPWALGMRAAAWKLGGKLDAAISDYGQEIHLKPTANAYTSRGDAWFRKKNFDRALTDFHQAVRINPKSSTALNAIAWLRATSSDPRFRDGREGVELATRACEATNWSNSDCVDTLAAAYAEAGDFDNAITYQAKALELSPDQEELKQHMELFKQNQPYREN